MVKIFLLLFISFSSAAHAAERMKCVSHDLVINIPDIQPFFKKYDHRGDVSAVFEFQGNLIPVTLKQGYFLDLSQWEMPSHFLAVPKFMEKSDQIISKIDMDVVLFLNDWFHGKGKIKFRYLSKTVKRTIYCEIE